MPGLSVSQVKQYMQQSKVLSITWTACLSGEMMLREVEGGWVQVVVVLLLGLTVAMVTAADVVGVVVEATVLLVSARFSPGLSLSISQVTLRFSNEETVEAKKTLINQQEVVQFKQLRLQMKAGNGAVLLSCSFVV